MGSAGIAVRPASDAVTTIALPGSSTRASRRTPKTTPSVFAPRLRRYCSSVSSLTSVEPVTTPAFRHASSTGPTESQAAGSATSKPLRRSSTRTSAPPPSSRSTIARPIPDAPPVTSAVLGNKHDLADAAALLDQPVRVRGSFEGERGADKGFHRPLLPEREHVADRLADDIGTVAHQPTESRTTSAFPPSNPS